MRLFETQKIGIVTRAGTKKFTTLIGHGEEKMLVLKGKKSKKRSEVYVTS
jgi:hypothetical protein